MKTFSKYNKYFFFIIFCVTASFSYAKGEGNKTDSIISFDDTWQGTLVVDKNQTLTVQFIINEFEKGVYGALINSPDFYAIKNIPVSSMIVNENVIKLNFSSLSGEFNGTLINGTLSGEWK